MKRPVESLQDFKIRIAQIIGNKALTIILLAALCGCGSMEREIRQSSTAELQLRRAQVIYRINHEASMWGPHPWQHPDTESDLEEKNMIERELLRRGAMPQYQPI